MEKSFQNIAQRIVNAENDFIGMLAELHGYSRQQAAKILETYIAHKIVKLDTAMGRYSVKHGAFLDKQTLESALND